MKKIILLGIFLSAIPSLAQASLGDMYYGSTTYPFTVALPLGGNGTCLGVQSNLPAYITCGSGGGGSGFWPFVTTNTNYGIAVQSTTTPEWFQNGLHASSTSQIAYASTTALTVDTMNVGNGALPTPTLYGSDRDSGICFGGCGQGAKAVEFTTDGVLQWAFVNGSLAGSGNKTIRTDGNLTVAVGAGGAITALTIPSATGNAGFGTTSPSQVLSVQGNGLFSGSVSLANLTATGTLTVAGAASSTFTGGVDVARVCLTGTTTCLGGGGSGSVTSVATNAGLTGGTITTTGTIGLDTTAIQNGSLLQYNGSRLAATGTPSLSVGYLIGTSTATSTFAGGVNMTGNDCFAIQGTCLQTYIQAATAYKSAANYATATVLPGTPTYSNGSSGVGATLTELGFGALSVDGQVVSIGQRILVKNEATQANNGVYTVTATGSGVASYILTRSTDFNTSNDVYAGATVPVLAGGTVNGDTTWVESNTGLITIGTTNITFIESSLGTTPVTSVTATWPVISSGGTAPNITFGGLSTTTNLTAGQIPYNTGVNTFGQVATATVQCTGNVSCTSFSGIGSASSIALTGTIPFANGGTNSATGFPMSLVWSNGSALFSTSSAVTIGNIIATTTTATSTFFGTLSVGSSTPCGNCFFSIGSTTPLFSADKNTGNMWFDANTLFIDSNNNRVGVSSSTPGSIFGVQGVVNFTTATSSHFSTGGYDLLNGGCYAIKGVCVGGGAGGGSGTVSSGVAGQLAFYSSSGTTVVGSSSEQVTLGRFNATSTIASVFPYASTTAITSSGSAYFGTGGLNVAIGTSTPWWTLQMASATPYFAITDTNAPLNSMHWLISNKDGQLTFGTSTDTNTSTSTAMILDGNGQGLTVGSTTPVTASLALIAAEQSTETYSLYVAHNGSSTPSLVVNGVNGNGNVGIASTTPAAQFSVDGTSMFNNTLVNSSTASSTFYGGVDAKRLCLTGTATCLAAPTNFVSTTSVQALSTTTLDVSTLAPSHQYTIMFHSSSTSATAVIGMCFNTCPSTDHYITSGINTDGTSVSSAENGTDSYLAFPATNLVAISSDTTIIITLTNIGNMWKYGFGHNVNLNGNVNSSQAQFYWKEPDPTVPITKISFTTQSSAKTFGAATYISASSI